MCYIIFLVRLFLFYIPVEQKQPYENYDIAHNTGTIPVEQKQPYDKYNITQNTGTIPVEQKQPYDS
jgi:hypothetical protein